MNRARLKMHIFYRFVAALAVIFAVSLPGASVQAQVTAYKQAVAQAAASDKALAEFYQARKYKSIWTGRAGKDGQRRKAFLSALSKAGIHGLPINRYDPKVIKAQLRAAITDKDRGRMEVEMSRMFLQYSGDIRSGIVNPRKIDSGLVRSVQRWNRLQTLVAFEKSSPRGFFKQLVPKTPEYVRLMKEKLRLEKIVGRGGYGAKIGVASLKVGASGGHVLTLRNRLIATGYLKRSAAQSYDANMQKAVQLFQRDHGLPTDGVAGKATVAEMNKPATYRMQSIMVAMERERWFNSPRGKRHVLVNLTDFTAKIIDNGKVTFVTRSVVGKNQGDRRTPEFSDVMDHMVINPTWNVPRSIATKEYLPLLQRNRNAVSHLRMVDSRGRTVSRSSINFSQYTAKTFPFNIKQPPSSRNALGLVKFMFPNKYNIYLHDTPSKNLFARNVRAFSHGCIRLQQPFDFAYALLSKQMANPQEFFQAKLKTGRETRVDIKDPVPVHLIYRTAISKPKGGMEYRRDVYGRDAKIFNALSKAGVVLRSVGG
ncbi:peptidoglycan-binding protein [Marinosulfonomonas sp. PRT-SC04]|nr:peptidoglycan-binding protein [Marinosulfonomonas sp. PRT-SC04]